MDFSQFDARGQAERGTPLDLVHPVTLAPIIDTDTGQPCRVVVRSFLAPSVNAGIAALRRSGMMSDETLPDGMTWYEAHDNTIEIAALYIAGFEGVNHPEGRSATAGDARWFLSLDLPIAKDEAAAGMTKPTKPFAQQILEAVQNERNSLGNAPAP